MIETGNVNTKPNGGRGWILGHFIDSQSPFHSEAFEVKWSHDKQGNRKDISKSNKTAKSIFILINGKFKFDFPELNKSVELGKEGDYVFFDSGVNHSWEALTDTSSITIRWPSVPNDQ